MIGNSHAKHFGSFRQRQADTAQTDNAHAPTARRIRQVQNSLAHPPPSPNVAISLHNLTQTGQRQRHAEIGHTIRQNIWRICHGNPVFLGITHISAVKPDAKTGNNLEVWH